MPESVRVFISYKREEQPFAEQLRSYLRAWGYATWLDVDDIPAGVQPGQTGWDTAIHEGMKASQVVVGVMTPDALKSPNVLDEWAWARDAERRLFLLRLRECDPEDVPPRYARIQYIDLVQNQTTGLERLKQQIEAHAQNRRDFDELINPIRDLPKKAIPPYLTEEPKRRFRLFGRGDDPIITDATDYEAIRRRVYQYWVKGFKDTALADVQQIRIGLEKRPEAVVRTRGLGEFDLHDSRNIRKIYEVFSSFLILGEPGAGKTIMLLELAESLILDPPKTNLNLFPLVLNLSSWSLEKKSLLEWLEDESRRTYRVGSRALRRWLDNHDIALLLDGLDEVKEEVRVACLEAINLFRSDHLNTPVVVCCRINDYEQIGSKLDTPGAVLLQKLTPKQVDDYLRLPGLDHLRRVIADDPTIAMMTGTPFLLNAMIYAYRHLPETALRGYSNPVERRKHLFDTYFERRLSDNPLPIPYTKKSVRQYLEWLATKMQAYSTVFRPEDIQPHWLADSPIWFVLYRQITIGIVTSLLVLPFGLAGLLGAGIPGALSLGAYGLFLGLKTAVILPKEPQPIYRKRRFYLAIKVNSITILLFISFLLFIIFLSSVVSQLPHWVAMMSALFSIMAPQILTFPPETKSVGRWWKWAIVINWLIALCWTLTTTFSGTSIIGNFITAFFVAIILFFTRSINEYEHNKVRSMVSGRALITIGAGLLCGAVVNPYFGASVAIAVFLMFSILLRGGIGYIEHLVLRLVILRKKAMPLNLHEFLNAASQRYLLRRLGGGYIFVHRYLLEHFVKIDETYILLGQLAQPTTEKYARESLHQMESFTTEFFLSAVNNRSPRIKAGARIGLAEVGDTRAVESLIMALTDPNTNVRRSAAEALGRIADPRAIDALSASLTDIDANVGRSAAEALGRIADPRAIDALSAALKRNAPRRQSVIEALGRIGGTQVIEPLIATLMKPRLNKDEFTSLVNAFKAVGKPAIEPLSSLMQHLDSKVRERTVEILVNMRERDDAEPVLQAALNDSNWRVSFTAAKVLAMKKDGKAVESLLQALIYSDGFDYAEGDTKIIQAIESIGSPAVEPLITALKHPNSDVRIIAVGILGRLGDARAVEPLIPLLSDPVAYVRARAVEALRNIGTPEALSVVKKWEEEHKRG